MGTAPLPRVERVRPGGGSIPGPIPDNPPRRPPPRPPVEVVRPGVWSIPVPIPDTPLRYVLVYAFETDGGIYIVDAGWNTDEAYDTLIAGLGTLGAAVTDVRGVVMSHIHPDHYGLAGRGRGGSGGWGARHPAGA